MASFADDPEFYTRRDWALLQSGPVSMYVSGSRFGADLAWLGEHGYQIDRLDARRWSTELEMHEDFAAVLQFPDHYGKSLNAFSDCLSTLEIRDPGRVLVLERFDLVEPRLAHHVLDIIAIQARMRLRLIALIYSDDPTREFAPVGDVRHDDRSMTILPFTWRPACRSTAARS